MKPTPTSPKDLHAERRKRFSSTYAVAEEATDDIHSALAKVEQLRQQGSLDKAVDGLLRIAAVYMLRNTPIKAVAVLRHAAKMQPERPDVRMAYGEVFGRLRMVDAAVAELRKACDLYAEQQEFGHELEALRQLVALDPGHHVAQVRIAEALERAGRRPQALKSLRHLATTLWQAEAYEDWQKVAERLVFLDSHDTTVARALARHYVDSGRHAHALSKLLRCYEREPGDVELLELIVETLEHLGQRDRAATLMRELISRYRGAGLPAEVEQALRKLHELDPDDQAARDLMQDLGPSVDQGSVIEFDARSAFSGEAGVEGLDLGGSTFEETPTLGQLSDEHGEHPAGWQSDGLGLSDTSPSGPLLRQSQQEKKLSTVESEPPRFDLPESSLTAAVAVDPAEKPASPEPENRLLNRRRRSSNLPRPRLTRSAGGVVAGGPGQQALVAELKTLDFFIDRGFAKSASALLDELEKRYPNNKALRSRRQRINVMLK